MEEATGFDMEAYKYESDREMASVIGDNRWLGFARMRIHERGFTGSRKDKAETLALSLLNKKENLTAKSAAEYIIKELDKRAGYLN